MLTDRLFGGRIKLQVDYEQSVAPSRRPFGSKQAVGTGLLTKETGPKLSK